MDRSKVLVLAGSLIFILVFSFALSFFVSAADEPEEEASDVEYYVLETDDGLITVGVSNVTELRLKADTVVLESELDAAPYAVGSMIAGGCRIEADTSQLGRVDIYVPVDYQDGSFTLDASGNLVNIRSSTITGILYRGSTPYTFRCASFSTPQYRAVNGSGSYLDLTVQDIVSANVRIVTDDTELPLLPNQQQMVLIFVLMMGVICACQFMRR